MTVTLNLTNEEEQRLQEEAQARGLAVSDLLHQVVAEALLKGKTGSPEKPARIAGLHAGAARIADDFDAPLPDAFWLGDE